MPSLAFKQVDVFTRVPFRGNPVAVILDGDGLDTEQMQAIANWTNLSETTFVQTPVSPQADYRLRIFTPASELPFAGHPTLGSAHALLEAGRVRAREGLLVQECAAGLVKLEVAQAADGARTIAFELPPPVITALDDTRLAQLESILGVPFDTQPRPRLIDVGARWIVVQLGDAQTVLRATPDLQRMRTQDIALKATGVVIFGAHPSGTPARVEVRAFAPSCGVPEDPVCGSGNGCMAVFVRDTGQVQRLGGQFIASQGRVVGRDGKIAIRIEADRIRVGGEAVTCIEGRLST